MRIYFISAKCDCLLCVSLSWAVTLLRSLVPTDGLAYSRFTQTALRTHVAHQHYHYYVFVLKGKFFATE